MLRLLAFILALVPAALLVAHAHTLKKETADPAKTAARGLALVQGAASRYPTFRKCFSCHHQTLPMLAMVAAGEKRQPSEEQWLDEQARFTHKSFEERTELMKEGKGVGGASLTVGYGLWALELAGWKPDDTTEAMVTFLLKNQKKDGHWERTTSRPPLEDSNITTTVLAAAGMRRYATADQNEPVEKAVNYAWQWLVAEEPKTQEDRVFKLWGVHRLGDRGGAPEQIETAREQVLRAQRQDGGWGQLDGMASDAYATGQTLYVLQATGLPPTDPACARGLRFLLKTQCDDGSWRVETRSKPIQVYFDNGDPHDKHQFISTPATAWAVAALAAAGRQRP